MRVTFSIQYKTEWGQKVCVVGSSEELGAWDTHHAAEMHHDGGGDWTLALELDGQTPIHYKYILKNEQSGGLDWEWGKNREITLLDFPEMEIKDVWRSYKWISNTWFSAAFTDVIFRRKISEKETVSLRNTTDKVLFRLHAAAISPEHSFGIIGSDAALGNWEEEQVLIMSDAHYPVWEVPITLDKPQKVIQYKYVICETATRKILAWEGGENRSVHLYFPPDKPLAFQITDEAFQYEAGWRGAGVALPVFSLRTAKGGGVGEFPDLKNLVDWAVTTHLRLIQILPINDTIATHTWQDSYPYSAISVFALHPMYINLQEMGELEDETERDAFEATRLELNALPEIDYERVMRMKSRYFKILFDQEKKTICKNKEFIAFIENNSSWLKPYAVFSHLRDLFGTADFQKWRISSVFTWDDIEQMCNPRDKNYPHIAIHFFIQYHAHRQLLAATEYARAKRVCLKGDIPIGISRYSVDAWMNPQLYNMNVQAGAPPDDFAVAGQNWGFPTYNWEEMAKDGYKWWKDRFLSMATYFDAFRIDHILGFFRIWQIPIEHVQGLMGVFHATLPLHVNDLRQRSIHLDYERLCRPYIRDYFLPQIFGEYTQEVKEKFLYDKGYGIYELKPEVSTQKAVQKILAGEENPYKRNTLESGLFQLIGEVLFFDDGNGGLNPRISIQKTRSFQALEDDQKWRVEEIYHDYFFHRMNDFWREKAMEKLPALVGATDMLVCGEDLGMIPDSVAGVMQELNILSLEIQRMPKGNVTFGNPSLAPYLSVVSPSCHDMSTIRGWWEENPSTTQRFFHEILHNEGQAPYYCEPWVAKQIIEQHLWSPAMWAIFPIQDLLALDSSLRREVPQEEQINVPANPNHYWRYRFHLNLEDLLQADSLNSFLRGRMISSGRAG